MGQATVDLPDPLQSPAAPATAGTDDLLAQLAGDEIERLLAETETERPAAPASMAAVVAPAAPVAGPTAAAPLPDGIAASAPAASAAVVPDPKENLATELDALFKSVETAAPSPTLAPAPASPIAPPAPAAAPAESATSSAELKALGEPIHANDSAAVAADAAAALQAKLGANGPADPPAGTRPSLLIRLLELINSPLDQCSDSVRQAVGKIAIATLLNAIAVLVYTLIFRHR